MVARATIRPHEPMKYLTEIENLLIDRLSAKAGTVSTEAWVASQIRAYLHYNTNARAEGTEMISEAIAAAVDTTCPVNPEKEPSVSPLPNPISGTHPQSENQ